MDHAGAPPGSGGARRGPGPRGRPTASARPPSGARCADWNVEDTERIAGRLPALGLPAGIVWGEADRFQKLHYGLRLAEDLGAELTRIPDGKHFTPEDHPREVAEAVDTLLR